VESQAPLYVVAPRSLLSAPARPRAPEGYELRTYHFGDELEYSAILSELGPGLSGAPYISQTLQQALPEGIFFAIERESRRPVGTVAALHKPSGPRIDFPFGGEIGNLIIRSDHRRRGLGSVLVAAALGRFGEAGYTSVRAAPTEHRLPALRLFLGFGFLPLLYTDEVRDRWRTVCANVGLPYTPGRWPSSPSG
jgi:GNAT superfamily N-acetyltransferase